MNLAPGIMELKPTPDADAQDYGEPWGIAQLVEWHRMEEPPKFVLTRNAVMVPNAANARIVAAVNACEGIPTKELVDGVVTDLYYAVVALLKRPDSDGARRFAERVLARVGERERRRMPLERAVSHAEPR